MNLKFLSKTELDSKIKSLAKSEREILHEILLTIKEIDTRRTYLELGYSNLFSYLTEGVGYSAGSAQRRIEAARLLADIPELAEKIQNGEITLNQVSLVQKASRDIQRTRAIRVSSADKSELLNRISCSDFKSSQKEVAQFFDLPVVQPTVQTVQADESVRVELTLSKEFFEKIQEAQALLSHSLPSNDLVGYLSFLTEKVVKQKTSVRKLKQEDEVKKDSNNSMEVTSTWNESGRHTSYSVRNRKIILSKQRCCQYVDPESGKQCRSNWFLQVDHVKPQWAGGVASIENAQILCGTHNRIKYLNESGRKFIS